jgi:hypothetical protein
VVNIDKVTKLLSVKGIRVDTIETCSIPFGNKDFHINSSSEPLAVELLWKSICGKTRFDLVETYLNGEPSVLAYLQTLSNGCTATAARDIRDYHDISKTEWLSNGAAYLTKALEGSNLVSDELLTRAADGDRYKWTRAANGASSHRAFARTTQGYYVLGPKVMETGDLICVLYGGKMPFCLRPWEDHFLLSGECYVHGLMDGEAVSMVEDGILQEETFYIG